MLLLFNPLFNIVYNFEIEISKESKSKIKQVLQNIPEKKNQLH